MQGRRRLERGGLPQQSGKAAEVSLQDIQLSSKPLDLLPHGLLLQGEFILALEGAQAALKVGTFSKELLVLIVKLLEPVVFLEGVFLLLCQLDKESLHLHVLQLVVMNHL